MPGGAPTCRGRWKGDSPAGLVGLFKADPQAADAKPAAVPTDYLPLRDYQFKAVERVIAAGRRLLASNDGNATPAGG